MKKAAPYILLAVLVVIALLVRRCNDSHAEPKKTTRDQRRDNDNTAAADRNRGFDRRISYLEYTQHAKCRMECRHITQEEVKDIMQNGKVNYNKSEASGKPCPIYALEGYTQADNQHVRIVFAQCDYKTKVVTCIDLDNEFECHCPGDNNKNER
jgi:hypothetical protein